MKNTKVLIAPAGSGMAITAIKSLMLDSDIEIIVADSNHLAPSMNMGLKSYTIPTIEDERFFPVLEQIIESESIDILIPCLDPFLIPVANNRERLEALGVKVMISPVESIKLSRDKWEMYKKLKGKIPLPESWIDIKSVQSKNYPLFIKPRDGSGSIDAYRIENSEELEFYFGRIKHPIIQEYLPGREYTVDCLTDLDGKLIVVSPRERIKTKAGICTISKTVKNPALEDISMKITEKVYITGPFFFQAKEDKNGTPKVTELNIRLAGTMILTTKAGANIPLIATKILLGEKVDKSPEVKEGFYLSRFWEEVYFSEESTIQELDRGNTNLTAVGFSLKSEHVIK